MSIADRLKSALDWVERRQHPRTNSPLLKLKVDGQKYTAVDWSLGGCRIGAPSDRFEARQRVTGRVWLAGAEGRGEFVAEVVRIDGDGQVALRWLEISPHVFIAMNQ